MSTCSKCGGSLANPFDFSSVESTTCQCNTGGLVLSSSALPNEKCCVESVNEKVGKVVLNIDDIDLLDKVFFTEALAVAAFTPEAPIGLDGDGNLTHNDSTVVPGVYGSDTDIPVFTVDSKGHITNVTNTPMATPAIGDDLTAIEAITGIGYLIRTAANTWTLRSIAGTAGQILISDGDGVSNPTTIGLEASGVVAGSYGGPTSWPVFTVDEFGRIVTASVETIPAVVIPAHTHALGDLSNVSATADAPTTNDVLKWDGSEWIPSSSSIVLSKSSITCEATVHEAYSTNDLDAAEGGAPINTVYKLVGADDRYKISINAIFYIAESDLAGFPGADIIDLLIGRLPANHAPIHPTYVNGVSFFSPVAGGLTDSVGTAFAGLMKLGGASFMIDTDGKIYLSLFGSSAYSTTTLGGIDTLVLPLVTEFLTKLIVP